MASCDELREEVLRWTREDENIRAVLETGSFVRAASTCGGLGLPDVLSDLDIELYARDVLRLAADDAWLRGLAPLWVVLPLENGPGEPPSRLCIYEGGAKIDFSLHQDDELLRLAGGLGADSSVHDRGARVLLDKDLLLQSYAPQVRGRAPIPTREEFEACVREWWFESHYVGKYLRRSSAWTAQNSDRVMKELLLQMLEWHAVVVRGQRDVWFGGRFLREWAGEATQSQLALCFARGDVPDGWRALFESLALFRRLALEVASRQGFAYESALDEQMTNLLRAWHREDLV